MGRHRRPPSIRTNRQGRHSPTRYDCQNARHRSAARRRIPRRDPTHPDSHRIDVSRAQAQHAAFCAALEGAGLRLLRLSGESDLPDATFVSDTLVALAPVLPGRLPAVVVARPTVASRRLEVDSVLRAARASLPVGTRVVAVEDPGTLEGGDVVVYGDRVAIGLSARTNVLGARMLADVARSLGYRPFLCPVTDRLHLATAVTKVTPDALIGTAAGFASLDAAGSDAAPPGELPPPLAARRRTAGGQCPGARRARVPRLRKPDRRPASAANRTGRPRARAR